ncbi:hypothetical protein ACTFIW_008434 [Dictyostelium discoideum]
MFGSKCNIIKSVLLSSTRNNGLKNNFRLFSSDATLDHIKLGEIKDMKEFMKIKNERNLEFTNEQWLYILKTRGGIGLPNYMGLNVKDVGDESVTIELPITKNHLASNGYVHAGSIVTLADTSCGYACFKKLPKNSIGFTTIELKSNFIGTAKEGDLLECTSTLLHAGKTSQVWDAVVTHNNRKLAFFRCTEIILYPQPSKISQ